ncbi:Zn-dependent hydrolase [Clostridium sp. 'deep sea']|uniref:Zn-dependent hydrolase n=1 Tax=Clostridium sp. 'deep sea' TaxID=2779445 RepID=UPI0018964BAF|nr:Zn-dependent hydrolase [Clostridium sp. 'deep sea']QOR34074.1 Zn-dependent hydrolase [Clostridium sp. 'deep sea']
MQLIDYNTIGEMLQELAKFGRTPEGGVTRYSFTQNDMKARELVIKWMKECDMSVRVDEAGNIIGRLGDYNKPAVALGSHIDSVPNGGIYDGPLGVTTAIAIAKKLKEQNIKPVNPLEIIVFSDEEGARFGGGLFGSKVMTGILEEDALFRVDENGISAFQALQDFGLDPSKLANAHRSSSEFKAYIEVHIEQAHVLEESNLGVGIVKGIAGPVHFLAEFTGKADHAGATPMTMRKDALLAACEVALTTESIAKRAGETTVATVGKLEVSPGATNVIPGKVVMSFDVRDINLTNREWAVMEIKQEIARVAEKRDLDYEITELSAVAPVLLSEQLVDICEITACEHGIEALTMISGAAHDAMNMTKLTDVVMLFVKSVAGLSHCPQEYSYPDDIKEAANLLYFVVKKLIEQ